VDIGCVSLGGLAPSEGRIVRWVAGGGRTVAPHIASVTQFWLKSFDFDLDLSKKTKTSDI